MSLMKTTMQNLRQNQSIIDVLPSNIHVECQRRFTAQTVDPDLSQGTHQTPLSPEVCDKLFASHIYKITNRQRQYYYCRCLLPTALYNNGRSILGLLQFARRSLYSRSRLQWAADPRKVPDLISFAVTKKILWNLIRRKSVSDLSSDKSPVGIPLLQIPEIIKHY